MLVVLREESLQQCWQNWCAASPSQAEQLVNFRLEYHTCGHVLQPVSVSEEVMTKVLTLE